MTHQLRFDTGAVALNLVATRGQRGSRTPAERLPSPARLRDWLAANGLPAVEVGEVELARAHQLRDCAYEVLAALALGAHSPSGAVTELGELAGHDLPGPRLTLDAADVPVWLPAEESFETVLTRLARELAGICVERADQLRLCEATPCRMVYLDTSRGRRRRWCSMERCGNAAKAARYRARRSEPA